MSHAAAVRSAMLLLLLLLAAACTDNSIPVTLTVQAVELTLQADEYAIQADALAAAEEWADVARVTLTAWPDNAIATQNALLSAGATVQARVVQEAVGTVQAVEATIRADAVSEVEAIAATDLAIQVATIDAGGRALSTAVAEREILVATATAAAVGFAGELVTWQAAGTQVAALRATEVAVLGVSLTAQAAAVTEAEAARDFLAMTVTVQADGFADELAALDGVIDEQASDLATLAVAHSTLSAQATAGAVTAAYQQDQWQGVLTAQAAEYGTQTAGFDAAIATQATRAATPAAPTPTFTLTPTATPTLTSSPTSTATATPTATATVSRTPTVTSSPSPTASPSQTASATPPSTFPAPSTPTATPAQLCWVVVENDSGVNVRRQPSVRADRITAAPDQTVMTVVRIERDVEGRVWLLVEFTLISGEYQGWVAADVVTEMTVCPIDETP